jgi:hypothetical protein
MANLEVSHSSTVPHPTHQQLDDLDALLQQMLSVPVQPAADEAAEDRSPPKPEQAAESVTAPSIAEPSASLERPTDRPAVPSSDAEPTPTVEPEPLAALEQLEAALSDQRPTPEATSRPTDAWHPSPSLLPLVWCNRIFDGLTVPLGPLGRWLRGPSGRLLLGWTGLALLATALALSLFDLIRWIW